MIRHYIEPVGWLLVCLLFVVALAYVIASLGMDGRQPARPTAFDVKVTERTGK